MAADDTKHCQVEPAVWKACAGTSFEIPPERSRVYYFPQGHMEHSSDAESVLPLVSHLSPKPFVLCRVVQVLYLVDSEFDEVYVKIRLHPLDESLVHLYPDPPSDSSDDGEVLSYVKVLTPSDANNGGGFSVPRACADSIFPPLDFSADPPLQTLNISDLRGHTWTFRHIFRGTPRRHLLTTGWSKYVNSKKLVSGDSVVFMKNSLTGKLFLGVRKGKKSSLNADLMRWIANYQLKKDASGAEGLTTAAKGSKKGKISAESVAEALNLAVNQFQFEVVYYPKVGSPEFVVPAVKVCRAVSAIWSPGIRVKIGQESKDSSRMTWFEGTVSSLSPAQHETWQRSPWKMLQVKWDEPEALKKMERVSPWQVEVVPSTQSIDPLFTPAKRNKETDRPSDSVVNSFNLNTFPDGIQGARHVSSTTANVGPVSQGERTMAVSTDLKICSSQTEESSSSAVLSGRDLKIVRLFGNTFSRESPVRSPKQDECHKGAPSSHD